MQLPQEQKTQVVDGESFQLQCVYNYDIWNENSEVNPVLWY